MQTYSIILTTFSFFILAENVIASSVRDPEVACVYGYEDEEVTETEVLESAECRDFRANN